jgi:hypothetical protein
MTLPDVSQRFETRHRSRALPLRLRPGHVAAEDRQVRSGPHVNQLDRDAIEDRGLSYFAIEDDQQTRAIQAVMPS